MSQPNSTMDTQEPTGGAPPRGTGRKRALSEDSSSSFPIYKVPKRDEERPVIAQRVGYWNESRPPQNMKEKVKANFVNAAKRASQLKDHKLLYQYKRIKPTEMRLLYISPAQSRNMDLFVSIGTIADKRVGSQNSDCQAYEALSYHWGPGPADKPVYLSGGTKEPKIGIADLILLRSLVPDYGKGQRFYVRPSLDQALRHLRHQTEMVILWVDAVCINQSDEKGEKPEQIAKMKDIYNKAERVCIWLGDGKGNGVNEKVEDRTKDFHAAMDFSREIIQLKRLEALSQDSSATKYWSDLLDLMRCSWFSRRWVIQELALARKATIHCGEKTIPWQEFADAIGLFALNFDKIRALFRSSKDDRIFSNYRNFNELEPLGAKVLVDAVTNTFRKSVDDNIFEPVFDLETLVSSLTFFESSDPRDTIYALLNISRESLSVDSQGNQVIHPPKPDYERDILEVYTDFLEWVVFTTNSLDMICRQWAMPERVKPGGRKNPTPIITLPSWIQTINKSAWGLQEQGFNGRMNGDSIVGKAGRRRYNASRGMSPVVQFGKRRRGHLNGKQNTRTQSAPSALGTVQIPRARDVAFGPERKQSPSHRLYVTGIEIGHVTWTHGPVSRSVITKDCLEKGGWKKNEEMTRVPDKLWRTLVADRNAEGENPPPWYHRAALHSMALADNNGHIACHEQLEQENTPSNKLPHIVAEYLKRVQAVTWNRKFIEGYPKAANLDPLFGLGPPDTEENDRICILFGCSVPCILRLCETNNIPYYQFVGEAYIYGRMDGEAITMMNEEDLEKNTREFVII
ncbi:unnamed protein product [Periconia digitata]|uniref:Heterokaryon incompatibility domain-containing protein n=1 Tax=Periconia digitata TaxID=1303443 RepID=A0A9W4XQG8_9PLEO|nr:unnamed protein product [Periconia digitata]